MQFMVIVKANRDTEAGVMPGTADDFGAELREREERRRVQAGA